jgi:putative hydroxymethylpyrimidine transport system substrate-binding protein
LTKPSSLRTTLALTASLACTLALAACGTKQDVTTAPATARPFTVMLDWFPNADHAALYAAIAHGDFRAVGLDVQPVVPPETEEPLRELAAGKVDMAISYEPELLLARDRGLKVVSIAALVQRPLTSIIALPGQHVSSVKDLAGKRVGTAGLTYQAAELRAALQHAGVNPSKVQEVNVGYNLVPAMLSGKVAATLGGFWNYEAIQLQLLHKHPVVIPVNEAGVPDYNELVLVVREGEAHTDGVDLRAFLQALARGEHEVRADPAAAAKLVQAANPSLEPKLQLESIERTLPAAQPAEAGKPFGYQDSAQWEAFGRWMYERGLLRHNPNTTGLPPFTNEFLPGEGI